MTDNRDFIDRSRSLAEKLTGESPQEIDTGLHVNFCLYGPRKRAEILDAIDAGASNGEIDIADLQGAMEKADLRNRLGELHEQLRRVGR